MPLSRIIAFCLDAAAFALPLGLLFLLGRLLWKRWKGHIDWPHEGKLWLFVTYLLALMKITAIRQAGPGDLSFQRGWESIQLLPLITTVMELKDGLWAFVYPVLGNIIWFLPFGFFLRWLWREWSWKGCLLLSAVLSLSIEISQWLLGSGISDVDDLIFNVSGALIGWWLLPHFLHGKERLL